MCYVNHESLQIQQYARDSMCVCMNVCVCMCTLCDVALCPQLWISDFQEWGFYKASGFLGRICYINNIHPPKPVGKKYRLCRGVHFTHSAQHCAESCTHTFNHWPDLQAGRCTVAKFSAKRAMEMSACESVHHFDPGLSILTFIDLLPVPLTFLAFW